MVITRRLYKFYNLSIQEYNWIRSQPGFVGIDESFSFVFDHADDIAESDFKTALSNMRGFKLDGINTNIAKFIDEIKTDQLFFTTETAVTKTNVGTAYIDIFTDFGGRPFFIDTTGFTGMAVQILWTKIGTGTQTLRIVEDSTNIQIIESGSLVTGSNDFSNVVIPQGALNFKGKWRLQCKSTVASDDPSFAGFRL